MNIADRREFFFDDQLVNVHRTTAERRLHHPIKREMLFENNEPWANRSCIYYNYFKDGDIYRMYYTGQHFQPNGKFKALICYAESKDGLHWVKPDLHICMFNGSDNNNIVLTSEQVFGSDLDNFMVCLDENPLCPAEERFKGIGAMKINGQFGLHVLYSGDGLHFRYGKMLEIEGHFDSLNILFWDKKEEKYRCYFRGFHTPDSTSDENAEWRDTNIRDIRYTCSPDLTHWSTPKRLDFGDAEDVPLYTSVMQPYFRGEHITIGFPTRYINRGRWLPSYDMLCGKEARKENMEKLEPRAGLAVTDCIFIASRDGVHYQKFDQAFMTPGPERADNWVYGDCYPARGLLRTPSTFPGEEDEISFFVPHGHRNLNGGSCLVRYSMRCDGFVSMHADATEKMLVTKPFTYQGKQLFINFSTSALGYFFITLVDENGERYESGETFGDSIDRCVTFPEGVVEKLAGKTVTLEFRFRDADLYSFVFQ